MVQSIPFIAGGVLVLFLITGFVRSFWQTRKRARESISASNWDNDRPPEHIVGAGGGYPPDTGDGHHP